MKTVGNIARPKATEAWAFDVSPPLGSRSVLSAMLPSTALSMSSGLRPWQACVMSATSSLNGWKMQSTMMEPITLKSTWPMAVRLAARLPLSEASTGVMVVPMLPPRMMAQPSSNEIHP